MKILNYLRLSAGLVTLGCLPLQVCGQTGAAPSSNTMQTLAYAGLRSVNQQGQINAVQSDAAGDLYLLIDQKDGVRVLKVDNAGNAILAQALIGAQGDIGTALTLDPAGNVYVAGTTLSTSLAGTAGAAIPNRTDASTNSFVAKFDSTLKPQFVTFTGGSRIAATAIAATADAVFVTGITYATHLPVTGNGIQQRPALGSAQNGFVEKFSASGSTLLYATYLTGALGDTTPAALAADAADNVYVAGSTSASGFPTVAALVPSILSNPSGFLTKLPAGGDAITFSTFVPGAGLTSLALDAATQTLLLSGSIALGQFPVDSAATPLIPTTYQVLLRLPLDGSTVKSSTLIAPGTQSYVAVAPGGAAWVDGSFGTPVYPLLALTPLASVGSGYAVRVSASGQIDQTARFGGTATSNTTFAGLPLLVTSIAVDPAGEPLIAGAVQPTASSSLLATETYDLPLRNTPTPALPSTVHDAVPSTATCNGSLCTGSAAYLAKLNPNTSAPALALSGDDAPFFTLRNLGTAQADGLQISSTGASASSNCGTVLAAGGECSILLAGGGPGTLTASSSNGGSQSTAFGTFTAPVSTIVYSPRELDFGLQTSGSPAAARTITVTNLGTLSQTFNSSINAAGNPKTGTVNPFSELSSDCTLAGSIKTKVLAPGGTCHITLGLSASAASASDGLLQSSWSIGGREVTLNGFSQSAALNVSSSQVDFGTQFSNGLRLPRFLYLSNGSGAAVTHAPLSLPAGSPFTLTDGCAATLPAGSVCRIRIDYLAPKTTSTDSTLLSLDQGLSVLITGETLPPHGVTGASVNPNLSVNPASVTFLNATPVTGIGGPAQTITILNTGASSFPLSLALTGDFTDVTSCGASLGGGQSCAVSVSFAPAQPGARQGLLAVTAGAGFSPLYVPLSGIGSPILPANNGTLELGAAAIGQPVTQFFKVPQSFNQLSVTATGPYGVILVEDVGFGHGQPPATAFAASAAGSCHNCFLGVQFTPTAAGVQPGTLTIASVAGGSPYTLALTGSGVPLTGLVLTPLAQDFGSVPVHSTSGPTLFTLMNLTGTPAQISQPVLTGDFTLSAFPTGGAACGGTLAYTASCVVGIQFSPTVVGSRRGSLSFNSGTATVSATLTGLATADPGLAFSPLALSFNNVPGLAATTQTVTIQNTSATTASIGTPAAGSAAFHASSTCRDLAPGTSCSVQVFFLPGMATVQDMLTIPVTNPATGVTQNYTVALSGNYTSANTGLQIVPGQTQYGPTPVGTQSSARLFTITNLTAKPLTLNISIPRQFVLVGAPCGGLAPNASCSFSVAFLPLTNGDIPGSLYAQGVPSDGSATLSSIAYVEGFGTGAGALTLTGGLIVNRLFSFGQVTSGQTSAQTFTLANRNPAGSPPITVRRVSSGPPFLSTTTCGKPLTVGQSCSVIVTYAPSNQVGAGTVAPATTPDAGNLVIESDAATSPDILNLSGMAGPVAVANPVSAAPLATYTLSQGSLTFTSTTVGFASGPQTITLANTGTVTINVSAVSVVSATAVPDFSAQTTCGAILPGASCSITVASTPQAAGARVGTLEIASDSAVSLEFVSLLATGTPSVLTLAPASLDFGPVLLGSSAVQTVQATNTSGAAIVFNGITASGDYSAAGTCPAAGGSLAGGATCAVAVTFAPVATGTRQGVLSLATSASSLPLLLPLTGLGIQPKLVASPAALDFGSVGVGSTSTVSLTLLNSGAVSITNLALSVTGDYAVTTPCPQTTLTAGASCAVQIAFTPQGTGTRTGALTVASSDPGSPTVVALTGIGTPGGSFSMTVDGSDSSTVTVVSGQPATYRLAVTPAGGFNGTVALTCAPVIAAQYASCSLLPPSLVLSSGTQNSIATINTITSLGGNGRLARPLPERRQAIRGIVACLLLPGLFAVWRGRGVRRRLHPLAALLFAVAALLSTGCGGGTAPPSTTLYTPPGIYQYRVSASSTTGAPATQTVTLNLIVSPR